MLLSETLTIMDNVKTAEFVLRGASGINCLFSDVEVGGIRFRCVNGVLVGEFIVVSVGFLPPVISGTSILRIGTSTILL